VLTFRKLIKVTTFSGTVKTAQQPLKVLWPGCKRPFFYAVNAFIKPVVPMIFVTLFRL
jgi:hypothetical protein